MASFAMREELDKLGEALAQQLASDSHQQFPPSDAELDCMLRATTDVSLGDADPYGDGDQRFLSDRGAPKSEAQPLRDLWCSGGDFRKLVYTRKATGEGKASPFICACFFGDVQTVHSALATARAEGGDALFRLLERRESTMRFTPLLACVAGTKMHRATDASGELDVKRASDCFIIAEALLGAGANVAAKDVAGETGLSVGSLREGGTAMAQK